MLGALIELMVCGLLATTIGYCVVLDRRLRRLKAEPKFRTLPVIMLTTEGQDAKKEQGRAAGAKAWIVKPFNPPQLLDAVSKLVLN